MGKFQQILLRFFPDAATNSDWQIQKIESGLNNTTRSLTLDGQAYIIRIYQNHQDPVIVAYEHQILNRLSQIPMSFATPRPILTQTGETHITLPDGSIVALFPYIEGTRCDLDNPTQLHSIGAAMGELLTAMADIQTAPHPIYATYAQLYEIHPLVTRDTLFRLPEQPEWGHLQNQLHMVLDEISTFETAATHTLPRQLIHADFVESNLLVHNNQVSGILDFEFAAPDLRIMELACFLTTLLKDGNNPWPRLQTFLQGYSTAASLTPQEISAIPLCMKNRRLVSFIHCLGRQLAGLDSQEVTETQIDRFIALHDWLQNNEDQLIHLVDKYLQ